MYKFEKLTVWIESVELIKMIYRLCDKLPGKERKNIIDQLMRAALSINLNIAEGSGSQNDKEFCRYLYLSRKSLFETVALLKLITIIHKINTKAEIEKIEVVGKLLNGLINKLKSNS